jgi:hypothetical protein
MCPSIMNFPPELLAQFGMGAPPAVAPGMPPRTARLFLALALLCGCAHAQILAGVISSSGASAAPTTPGSVMGVESGRESTGNDLYGSTPWTFNFYFLGPYLTGTLGGVHNCTVIMRTATSPIVMGTPTDENSDTFTKIDNYSDASFGFGSAQVGEMWVGQTTAGSKHFSYTYTGSIADGSAGGVGLWMGVREFYN